ncbi:MAG: dTMP kinase [Bacteroidota bacterium]|jgi:dTMP kinase|nr:dTMP kinase [Bacteroidota bacterium]
MFISFEGIDCSGKSTQIDLLAQRLEENGYEVLIVREPGGTPISERIRELLLDLRHREMDRHTELLLFSASRSQLVTERILPALHAGIVVIADRFHDSTTAYQGYGRGLDITSIEHVQNIATHQVYPDRSFFLDISVAESIERRKLRLANVDRMEEADGAFFQRVRDGYLHIASTAPSRFRIIDGMRAPEPIAEEIWGWVVANLPTAEGNH